MITHLKMRLKNSSHYLMLKAQVIVNYYPFTFSYPCIVEKVLVLGQTFEMENLMDLDILRSPESKNHIFNIWSVCLLA